MTKRLGLLPTLFLPVLSSKTLELSLLLFLVVGGATPSFAVSYVVPADQFEIERARAIVVGRVLGSHVEKTARFGIETVTDIAIEEAIKGEFFESIVQVHEPGGALGDEATLIPGVPRFSDGDRVLLLLAARGNGQHSVSDLALGSFRFVKDISGRELLVRDESEVVGREPDGGEHREQRRAADSFLDFVRGVARGEQVPVDYIVPTSPLAPGNEGKKTAPAPPSINAVFTANSYMLSADGTENGPGSRWAVFPTAVNWNQGNLQPGAPNGGTTAINIAFAAWNASGVNYVLASANPNSKGFYDNPADFINNIVFEKDLTAAGVQPFTSCGGVLGVGGVHRIFGTNVFAGETFRTTLEADVSMNQGLANCPSFVTSGDFNTVVTHEFGHTIGIRHSDQNRLLNGLCSSDPNLDCTSTAVLNHILPLGINAKLQTWDLNAVGNIYGNGPVCTPPSISQQPAGSTIIGGSAAQLSVTATGTPTLTYQWFVGSSGDVTTPVAGGTTAAISPSPVVTTSYWARVTGPCAPAVNSSAALVTIASSAVHGDANGDGIVGTADIFYLINYLFGGGAAPLAPCDVNASGRFDVADIFYLINYLFAGGAAPL